MHNNSSFDFSCEDLTLNLFEMIEQSPTAWHLITYCRTILKNNGFEELSEVDEWRLEPQKKYFVVRNDATLAAFIIPKNAPKAVRLVAAHSDSPGFKIKPKCETIVENMVLLTTEPYGGPLLTSWLNRDLAIAGRVFYQDAAHCLKQALVRCDDSPCVFPQLAIHLDREVNEKGLILNKQDHLRALAGLIDPGKVDTNFSYLKEMIAKQLPLSEIKASELFLFPLEKPQYLGCNRELMSSYRLDNVASFHALFTAFMSHSKPLDDHIQMIVCWDHEEIGSHSMQGASSPFINHVIERIGCSYQQKREEFFQLINRSFCVSIDVAHAFHPNYQEKHDAQHRCLLGKGVVMKTNAQHRYTNDLITMQMISSACQFLEIPLQYYSGRSDLASGSTIGPLHATVTGMRTIDIGTPLLSMHSARELMACQDHLDLTRLVHHILKQNDLNILYAGNFVN